VWRPKSTRPAPTGALYAACLGVVCRGPEAAADKATYVLTDEWLNDTADRGLTGDEALAELAVRHASSYGPVTVQDFARWSGLPLGRARLGHAAAGARIAGVLGPNGPLSVAADSPGPPAASDPPTIRMTGHFDPYLLGYHDRDLLLSPAFASRIATGGGLLMPCVLLDGEVTATWRHTWRGGRLTIRVEPLAGRPDETLTAGITAEVADLGRFLDAPANWEWTDRV
jgi:hypothetical protein